MHFSNNVLVQFKEFIHQWSQSTQQQPRYDFHPVLLMVPPNLLHVACILSKQTQQCYSVHECRKFLFCIGWSTMMTFERSDAGCGRSAHRWAVGGSPDWRYLCYIYVHIGGGGGSGVYQAAYVTTDVCVYTHWLHDVDCSMLHLRKPGGQGVLLVLVLCHERWSPVRWYMKQLRIFFGSMYILIDGSGILHVWCSCMKIWTQRPVYYGD